MVRAKGRRLGQDHKHSGPGDGGKDLEPQDIVLQGVTIDADSVDISDDQKLYLGSDNDYSIRYDSDQTRLVIRDEGSDTDKIYIEDNGKVRVVDDAVIEGQLEIDNQTGSIKLPSQFN